MLSGNFSIEFICHPAVGQLGRQQHVCTPHTCLMHQTTSMVLPVPPIAVRGIASEKDFLRNKFINIHLFIFNLSHTCTILNCLFRFTKKCFGSPLFFFFFDGEAKVYQLVPQLNSKTQLLSAFQLNFLKTFSFPFQGQGNLKAKHCIGYRTSKLPFRKLLTLFLSDLLER